MDYSIAKMKNHILTLVTLFSSTLALSQDLPKPLSEISSKNKSVLTASDLTNEQREYLWAGKSLDRAGFVIVRGDPEYIELVEAMTAHNIFSKKTKAPNRSGMALVGELNEGQHRTTRVYSIGKVKAAITTFEYRAAGAKVTLVEELVNQKFENSPATLALVIPMDKGARKGLWKFTVWTDDKIHEVYVPETLSNMQRPDRPVQSVLTIMEELIHADAEQD